MTAPAYACPATTIGPSVRSRLRLSAATSSDREVSGSGAASTFRTSALSGVMTRAQLDPSAHAPWASTTLTLLVAILSLSSSGAVYLQPVMELSCRLPKGTPCGTNHGRRACVQTVGGSFCVERVLLRLDRAPS